MIDYLIQLDEELLLFFNGFHTAFLDPFWKVFSSKAVWVPLYLALAYAFIHAFGWKRGLVLIAAIGLAVGCADFVTARLIRPFFERLRPANLENPLSELVHIVDGYRGGRYGFPSCHAANTFALAVSSALMARSRWYGVFVFCWAVLQCFSRMYLGVHYPGDLLAGACVGAAFGAVAYVVASKINVETCERPFPALVPIIVGVATVAFMALFAIISCFFLQ